MLPLDLGNCRIVDLSVRLVPGQEARRLEIRRGIIESDDTFMHEIDMMSHVGTHVEAPAHFYEGGKDITELPLHRFLGRAVLLNLTHLQPRADIAPADLERAAADTCVEGAILVLHSPHQGDQAPNLTREAAEWMAQRNCQMLAIGNTVGLGKNAQVTREVHDALMSADVPFLEVLSGLDDLRQREFILVALPLKIAGLDSSPVRAIAIEGL